MKDDRPRLDRNRWRNIARGVEIDRETTLWLRDVAARLLKADAIQDQNRRRAAIVAATGLIGKAGPPLHEEFDALYYLDIFSGACIDGLYAATRAALRTFMIEHCWQGEPLSDDAVDKRINRLLGGAQAVRQFLSGLGAQASSTHRHQM